jgi:glutamyl-tRNA synthetase
MIRTRFAPSPTGFLHVGGARTALYSWLYARKHQGQFILRIEDTDLERSTPEAVQAILDGMQWLGLNYDNKEPYYQTKHFPRYKEVLQELLRTGKAYRCYCSKERLETLRAEQMANKQKPRYDGHCRNITEADETRPHVIRFRNPEDGEVVVDDHVRGRVVFKNSELDDLILARSDGTPTYNFTVVVDDMDMKITHVIRGDDHLNNTPRQINIFKALGVEYPTYAHLPMILGSDGQKLSKRHGAVSVMEYRNDGYLPEALLNYLIRLGWSHGDKEIFSRDEMIQLFDIDEINNAAAAFNTEKLLWLNQHYIKTSDPNRVAEELAWHMKDQNISLAHGPDLVDLIKVQAERAKTLKEMAEKSRFFYEDIAPPAELKKALEEEPLLLQAFSKLKERLLKLSDWSDEAIHNLLNEVAAEFDLKLGKLAQPLRMVLTGGTVSPPINSTIRLLGSQKVDQRLSVVLL